MTTKLKAKLIGGPVTLAECPAGFFLFEDTVCFKSEYSVIGAFNEVGEAFWGGVSTRAELDAVLVQPLTITTA